MTPADTIASRLQAIGATLPPDGSVRLVAVSKFHPAAQILQAYEAGQRAFGESRAQELAAKAPELPSDIEWHFIGHLQTNKVRPVVARAAMIQSIDSERLLRAVDAEAVRQGRRIGVLLEAHVAAEESKTGLAPAEIEELLRRPGLAASLPGVELRGIMGMATLTDDVERVRADFRALRALFDSLRAGPMAGCPRFDTLSMGMSDDYLTAVAEGSTMVRIGTDIFGPRQY